MRTREISVLQRKSGFLVCITILVARDSDFYGSLEAESWKKSLLAGDSLAKSLSQTTCLQTLRYDGCYSQFALTTPSGRLRTKSSRALTGLFKR